MKPILSLLLMLGGLSMSLTAQNFEHFKVDTTEKSIFEYGETETMTQSEYITPFYFDYQGVSSYLFKSFTVSS